MKLEQTLKTTQTMTPQMLQTITILQYSAQELTEFLSELSYENPMVELHEQAAEPARQDPQAFADRLRWLQRNDRQNRTYYADDRDEMPIPAAQDGTLKAFLHEQLLTMTLPEAQRKAVRVLVELLDSHGFYDGTIEEAAQLARCPVPVAQAALQTLQQLDPPGVGAADVRESLLLQLRRQEEDTQLAERLLTQQYDRLASRSVAQLASALKAAPGEVEAALRHIGALNPYPADGFDAQEETIYIRPDLSIFPDEDGLCVTCNTAALPEVTISRQYLRMLETEQDPEVQQYLRQKLQQVQQVLHDMGNRRSTMQRCGEVLARRQEAFFYGGEKRKLTLRDVAEELEVHESTVCRVVKNKYIQCSRGIIPMSSFFGRSAGQNTGLCRENIQQVLSGLIRGEDPLRPYSDARLVNLLAGKNIILSRRAVAKYRQELGILPAYMRKAQPVSI